MSTKKKTTSTSSTAKPKVKRAASGSARSKNAQQLTDGAQRTTEAQSKNRKKDVLPLKKFSDLEKRIKEASSYTELAFAMKYVRDGAALVGIFDFLTDAQFFHEQASGSFAKAKKLALRRYRSAVQAQAKLALGKTTSKAEKAYGAAYKRELKHSFGSQDYTKKERDLIKAKIPTLGPKIKTPFETEVLAENPFNLTDEPIAAKASKGGLRKSKPSAKIGKSVKRV